MQCLPRKAFAHQIDRKKTITMKMFTAVSMALMFAFLMLPAHAESPPPNPSVTQPIPKKVERIAPPLATLIKQYKPDINAEAEIISRKTEITIDENYFSHSVSQSWTEFFLAVVPTWIHGRNYSKVFMSFDLYNSFTSLFCDY